MVHWAESENIYSLLGLGKDLFLEKAKNYYFGQTVKDSKLSVSPQIFSKNLWKTLFLGIEKSYTNQKAPKILSLTSLILIR